MQDRTTKKFGSMLREMAEGLAEYFGDMNFKPSKGKSHNAEKGTSSKQGELRRGSSMRERTHQPSSFKPARASSYVPQTNPDFASLARAPSYDQLQPDTFEVAEASAQEPSKKKRKGAKSRARKKSSSTTAEQVSEQQREERRGEPSFQIAAPQFHSPEFDHGRPSYTREAIERMADSFFSLD